MYRPPTAPISQTGRAQIRVPVVLSLPLASIQSSEERSANSKELIYFQGTAMTSQGLVHIEAGEFTQGDLSWFTLEEAQEGIGSFLAVFQELDSKDFLVLGDFHGFQKIFYSAENTNVVVVSDSLMALAQYTRNHGTSTQINLPTLTGQYGSFNSLLNHHFFSTQTIVEGIQQLRADQYLRLSRSSVTVERRSRFMDPKGRDYKELITDAITRGADFVKASLEWDVPDRLLFLSGGRDSRTVLAMALAGGVENQFSVFAKPPPGGGSQFSQKLSVDRQLSAQLIERYNLNLWEDRYTTLLSNADTERKWWLSHWAGVLHDYGSPKSGSLVPSVRLTGAVGENYRTKVPDFLSTMRDLEFSMTEKDFEGDFDRLFNRISPRHPGSSEAVREATRSMFLDSLTYEGIEGSLWERLDAYSEIFRQPTHFGGVSVEHTINTWNMNILAIPELTYAATMTAREPRAAGQVWRDLHAQVDPALNEIPYEYELAASGGGYSIPTTSSDIDWHAIDNSHSENIVRNTATLSNIHRDPTQRIDHEACKRLLSKLQDVLRPGIGQARIDYLDLRVRERSTLMKRLRGKLELLDELVDPQLSWNYVRVNIGR